MLLRGGGAGDGVAGEGGEGGGGEGEGGEGGGCEAGGGEGGEEGGGGEGGGQSGGGSGGDKGWEAAGVEGRVGSILVSLLRSCSGPMVMPPSQTGFPRDCGRAGGAQCPHVTVTKEWSQTTGIAAGATAHNQDEKATGEGRGGRAVIGDKRGPRDRARAMHGQGGRVSEGQRRPFCLLHLHRTKLLHRHAKRNMGRGEAGERRAGTSAGHGGRRCTGGREGGSAAPSVCCAADHTESRLHAGRTEVQWGSVSLLSALWRLSASEANDADPKLRIYAKRAFQQYVR